MSPLTKLYLYESWCEDLVEKNEFAKNYSTFIGAFSNIEMAKAISGEGVMNIDTSSEEFEESLEMVKKDIEKKQDTKPEIHRRRRIIAE
jgi:hypothetical protein